MARVCFFIDRISPWVIALTKIPRTVYSKKEAQHKDEVKGSEVKLFGSDSRSLTIGTACEGKTIPGLVKYAT